MARWSWGLAAVTACCLCSNAQDVLAAGEPAPPKQGAANLSVDIISRFSIGAASNSSVDVSEFQTFVLEHKYPFEPHTAVTEDGRMLQLFRLPRPGAPAVLLQHGILDSSWAWVSSGTFKGLAFQIYDAGYDVWLGNNRGNAFSMMWADGTDARHSDEFWDFTFDEMAHYDVPAMVGKVINVTGKENLAYVAHSQGTMQFLISASMPELRSRVADRVSVFVALSPVAWLRSVTALLFQVASQSRTLVKALGLAFPYGTLRTSQWRDAAQLACTTTAGLICKLTVDVICGTSPFDPTDDVSRYAEHFPFGTSWKNVVHFAQGVKTGSFEKYDYGIFKNLRHYGSFRPPAYNLTQMSVPTALLSGAHDKLADRNDILHLEEVLKPTGSVIFSKEYPDFSHATWLLGSRDAGYYTEDVLKLLHDRHRHVSSAIRTSRRLHSG